MTLLDLIDVMENISDYLDDDSIKPPYISLCRQGLPDSKAIRESFEHIQKTILDCISHRNLQDKEQQDFQTKTDYFQDIVTTVERFQ